MPDINHSIRNRFTGVYIDQLEVKQQINPLLTLADIITNKFLRHIIGSHGDFWREDTRLGPFAGCPWHRSSADIQVALLEVAFQKLRPTGESGSDELPRTELGGTFGERVAGGKLVNGSPSDGARTGIVGVDVRSQGRGDQEEGSEKRREDCHDDVRFVDGKEDSACDGRFMDWWGGLEDRERWLYIPILPVFHNV
jgi:hypothetical protein